MRLRPHAATASALLIAGFLTLSFQPAQAQSGTRVWSHEIGAQLWAPLAHEDGTLYFGADDGTFRAFDIGSREVSWRFDTGGMIRSTPVVDRGDVYFGSWDGNVYAVSAAGGSLVWQFDTGGIVQGSPALGAGKVFVGSRSAAVFALDAGSGELAWKHVNADGSWVESSPVYSDGVVYVGSSDALQLFALDSETGQTIWKFRTGGWSWSTPTLASGVVYIGGLSASPCYFEGVTLRPGFFAVDRKTGESLWEFTPQPIQGYITGGMYSRPAIVDGIVYVGALDGRLYALEE